MKRRFEFVNDESCGGSLKVRLRDCDNEYVSPLIVGYVYNDGVMQWSLYWLRTMGIQKIEFTNTLDESSLAEIDLNDVDVVKRKDEVWRKVGGKKNRCMTCKVCVGCPYESQGGDKE